MSALTRSVLGDCAVLTINRPQALNAITTQMLDQLEQQLDEIEKDDSRAFILTGAGRAFFPGTDLKEPPSDPRARIEVVHQLVQRLVAFPMLSVAAINGLSLADALAHEAEIMEAVSQSEDCVEGVMSFIEKREPQWKDC